MLLNEKARQYINEIESLYNIIILSYIVPWGPELDPQYHQYQCLIVLRMKTKKKHQKKPPKTRDPCHSWLIDRLFCVLRRIGNTSAMSR